MRLVRESVREPAWILSLDDCESVFSLIHLCLTHITGRSFCSKEVWAEVIRSIIGGIAEMLELHNGGHSVKLIHASTFTKDKLAPNKNKWCSSWRRTVLDCTLDLCFNSFKFVLGFTLFLYFFSQGFIHDMECLFCCLRNFMVPCSLVLSFQQNKLLLWNRSYILVQCLSVSKFSNIIFLSFGLVLVFAEIVKQAYVRANFSVCI